MGRGGRRSRYSHRFARGPSKDDNLGCAFFIAVLFYVVVFTIGYLLE